MSGSAHTAPQDFSFAEMGIGGLDKEFSDIFRRAFASRIFPASVVKNLGVNHVKGMLLYGPPGMPPRLTHTERVPEEGEQARRWVSTPRRSRLSSFKAPGGPLLDFEFFAIPRPSTRPGWSPRVKDSI